MTNKALIIGTGSIAKKHVINLHALKYKTYIYSSTKNKINLENKKVELNYIYDLKNLKDYDFAILANSTNKHINILNYLVDNKIHTYCEKPINNKIFNHNSLRKKIVKKKILVFIGFQLLQHKIIKYLKKKIDKKRILSFNFEVGHDLTKWRTGKQGKNRYFMNQSKGGGVIFELIHEVNLIQNLIGKIDYVKTLKKKSNKKNNFEDLAVSVIKIKNIIGSLNQDMVSPVYYRKIKILTKKKLFIFDMANNTLQINDKIIKINNSKDSYQNLLKKNLQFFIRLIKKKDTNMKYFDQSINDLKTAIKMHS